MNSWWVSALCGLAGLAILVSTLALLGLLVLWLLPRIAEEAEIRRRARHDYRTARGTQHLQVLLQSLTVLGDRIRARTARAQGLDRRLEVVRSTRAKELRAALSRHLVENHLTDVPRIGPKLSRRIIRSCFRGDLRDLRYASSVPGVGPTLQRAIMGWVYRTEQELPHLLVQEFPGKQPILARYAEEERPLAAMAKQEAEFLSRERELRDTAQTVAARLQKVRPAHFRRALRQGSPPSPVPLQYFQGVYPPWEPVPEWFKALLEEYGP